MYILGVPEKEVFFLNSVAIPLGSGRNSTFANFLKSKIVPKLKIYF